MKNTFILIFVAILLVVITLLFISFQVSETESAIVMTFNKPTRTLTDPGWYFKFPPPIQTVERYDSRKRVFEPELGETTTKGAVPIIVNTYVVWKVGDPLTFYNSVRTYSEAEDKLRSWLNNTQNTIIGKHSFSEFVNSDKTKIKLDEIQNEMLTDLSRQSDEALGIEVVAVGIKQLKINQDVSKDVFERMRSERYRKTKATISAGESEAKKIETDADNKKIELLATAEARAKAIRGQGDAIAAQYYKKLEADPDLAIFLMQVDAIKKMFEDRTTFVFSADTDPFKLFKELPLTKPKK